MAEGGGPASPRVIPYNGTGPTGGNPLDMNLNVWYEVSCFAQNLPALPHSVGSLSLERPQADLLRPQARGHRMDFDGYSIGFAHGSRRWVSFSYFNR